MGKGGGSGCSPRDTGFGAGERSVCHLDATLDLLLAFSELHFLVLKTVVTGRLMSQLGGSREMTDESAQHSTR